MRAFSNRPWMYDQIKELIVAGFIKRIQFDKEFDELSIWIDQCGEEEIIQVIIFMLDLPTKQYLRQVWIRSQQRGIPCTIK